MSEARKLLSGPPKRILALSSGGGHWTELVRLAPALEGHDVTWITTQAAYRNSVPFGKFGVVTDASMWSKRALPKMVAQIGRHILRIRPQIVISTGAAPGFFAIRLGNLFGARTIWLDSIANAEELSLSGRKIAGHADLYLTQWEHLAKPAGPHYVGAVV